MKPSDRPALAKDVVAREVAGETVLLNLATGTYFGLNEIGSLVWQWLEEAPGSTLADISQRLEQRFDVTLDQAQSDVLALAAHLAENGLLEAAAD